MGKETETKKMEVKRSARGIAVLEAAAECIETIKNSAANIGIDIDKDNDGAYSAFRDAVTRIVNNH